MSIQKVIYQIEELEKLSILNSRSFIEQYGWEKLKETLVLYSKGSSFGIPQKELEDLFKINPVEFPVEEKPPPVVKELPPSNSKEVEDLVEDIPIETQEDGGQEKTTTYHFLNNERIHNALYSMSNEGVIPILTNQVCILAGVEQSKGNLKKITQGLEDVGFKSKYVSNPLRFTRTRANLHEVDLNNLNESLGELWDYLSERRDKEMKLPIKLEDYLDGTEGQVRLRKDRDDLFITLSTPTLNLFKDELLNLLNKVYGDTNQLVGQAWLENTPLNKYLLSESLLKAYPSTTLRKLVKKEYPQLDNYEVDGTVQHLRDNLNDIQVKVGLLNENWSSIDTAISGFVYLIAIMSLNYHMDQ